MKLWLDDYRDPVGYQLHGFTWVKTADEAIALLKTGKVKFASLDHDLSEEDIMRTENFKERTGYDVVCWMEENNVWPPDGVRVHSMNPVGKARMEAVIAKHY